MTLTQKQRFTISQMLERKVQKIEIASLIGVGKNTII